MAFVKGPGPRAGSGREIYLFSTVPIPPDSATHADGTNAEEGPEPGRPEPSNENVSLNVTVSTSGSLPKTPSNEAHFPLTIESEGLASAPLDRVSDYIKTSLSHLPGPSISGLVKLVSSTMKSPSDPMAGTQVSRFSVKFADGEKMGLDVDFDEFPRGSAAYIVPRSGYSIVDQCRPAVLEKRGGGLLLFHLESKVVGGYSRHKIIAHGYNQEYDTDWVIESDENDMGFIEDDLGMSSSLNGPKIAAVRTGDNIYVFVTHAGMVGTSGFVCIYSYRPRASLKFSLTTHDVAYASGGYTAINSISAAFAYDRCVVAIGTCAYIGLPAPVWTVQIGTTRDMVVWERTNNEAFRALDNFELALHSEYLSSVHFINGSTGWAVTGIPYRPSTSRDVTTQTYGQGGRIYKTTDGGVTWTEQNSPVAGIVPLTKVKAFSENIVWAVGARGVSIKTTDGGTTWKVVTVGGRDVRDALDSSVFLTGNKNNVPSVGLSTLWDAAIASADIVWVVQDSPEIYYTTDGGATWKSYRCPGQSMIVDAFMNRWRRVSVVKDLGGGQWEIAVAGFSYRKVSDNYVMQRFCVIQNANSQAPTFTFSDVASDNIVGSVTDFLVSSESEFFAVTDLGSLLHYTGGSWSEMYKCTDTFLSFSVGGSSSTHYIIATASGYLLRSRGSGLGTSWIAQYVGTDKTLSGAVTVPDSDAVVVMGNSGIWYAAYSAEQRTYPHLCATKGGEILLATANMMFGAVEVMVSNDHGLSFRFDGSRGARVLAFPAQSSFLSVDDTTPYPSIFEYDDMRVIMTAGTAAASTLGGTSTEWVPYYDTRLPLPIGSLVPSGFISETNINKTRLSWAYGGCRLFSVVSGTDGGVGKIATFTAYEWDSGSTIYCPIIPFGRQWVGVGNVRCTFSGLVTACGDKWTVPLSYRFSKDNVAVDSPSIYFLSDSHGTMNLMWDRRGERAVSVMLDGIAWDITACALFGTNFLNAALEITVPSYNSSTWPTSQSDYVHIGMSSAVTSGLITRSFGPGGDTPANVIYTNRDFIPGQFRDGTRTYYIYIADTAAFKIVDNSEHEIYINNITLFVEAGTAFTIYTDRMFSDGSGGTIGGVPVGKPLIETDYRHGRLVRILIPEQSVPDGAFKIGTVILGRHVPVTISDGTGSVQRDRFGSEWRWRPVVHQTDEVVSRITTTYPLYRTGQVWSLTYDAQYWWDRDHTLSAVLPDMYQAFALVFDDNDVVGTLEIVRMTSQLPEVVHRGADLSGYTITIQEIV